MLLAVAVVSALTTAAQQAGPQSALAVGFHMVVPCDSRAASKPMQVNGKPTSYCLERPAFLNQNDVTSAAIDTTANDPSLVKLTLNEAAAQR